MRVRLVHFAELIAVGALALVTGCRAASTEGPAEEPPPETPSGSQPGSRGPTGSGGAGPMPGVGPASADSGAARGGPDAGAIAEPPARGGPDGSAPPGSDALPVIWIDVDGGTTIPNEPKVPARMRLILDHDGTFDGKDPRPLASRPVALETPIGIETRGNYSQVVSPKKSYSIELRDATGADRSLPLLGMPAESDWVLYACYLDKTCLRNALTYAIGRELGRYNPRTHFAELVLNGAYNGLYLVVERIKRDKNRLVLPAPAPDKASGDLTGGYMFRREAGGRSPAARNWKSVTGWVYTFHYPRFDEITAEQKAYLIGYVDGFERMMQSPDWKTRYQPWLDMQSWADNAIVQELSRNGDAYKKSQYFYKQSQANGDKMFLGPYWDYDAGWGNLTDYYDAWKIEGWAYQSIKEPIPNGIAPYFIQLWGDAAFQKEVRCRWQELRKGPLSMPWINQKIDGWVRAITVAQARDNVRWGYIGKCIWPNVSCRFRTTSYREEVDYLRGWIEKRLVWMDANLPGACAAP